MMEKRVHCKYCDHSLMDFNVGLKCSLTDRKPNFGKTCPKVKFGEQLGKKLSELHMEKDAIVNRAWYVYTLCAILFIAGICIAFLGYFLFDLITSNGFISTVPLGVMAVGFSMFPLAFRPLVKMKKNLRDKNNRIEEVSNLMEIYFIKYKAEIVLGKSYHGIQDVNCKLSFEKRSGEHVHLIDGIFKAEL